MSKLQNLTALLANGATIVLIKQTYEDQEQKTAELERKLLINGGVVDGKVTYIVAEPKGQHELGDRYLVVPEDEENLTVGKDNFSITEVVKETGAKLVRKYSVIQPAVGTFPPEPVEEAPEELKDKGGAVDAPAAAPVVPAVEDPSKKAK